MNKDIDSLLDEFYSTENPSESTTEKANIFNQPTRELAAEIGMSLPSEEELKQPEDNINLLLDEVYSEDINSILDEAYEEPTIEQVPQSETFFPNTEVRADNRSSVSRFIDNMIGGMKYSFKGEKLPEAFDAPGIGTGKVLGTTASMVESTPTVAKQVAEDITVGMGTLPSDLAYMGLKASKGIKKGFNVYAPALFEYLKTGDRAASIEEFNALSEEFTKDEIAQVLDTSAEAVQAFSDAVGTGIKESFDLLPGEEPTEKERDTASVLSLIAGGGLGARKKAMSYMTQQKAIGAEITGKQMFKEVVKGEVIGTAIVSSPSLDTDSLYAGLTGGEVDPTLDSRFVLPTETALMTLGLAGAFKGVEKGIKAIQRQNKVSKEQIEKLAELDNESVMEDVWIKSEASEGVEDTIDVTSAIKNEGGQQLANPKDEMLETSLRQNVEPDILAEMYPNYKALSITRDDMKSLFESKIASTHSAYVARYSPFYNMERINDAFQEASKTGRKDILEGSAIRKIQLIDEQSGVQTKSLIGDYYSLKDPATHRLAVRRQEDGLLEAIDGEPLNVVFDKAIKASGSEESVSSFLLARDTLDTIIYKNQQRESLEQQIKALAGDIPTGVDPSKKGFIEDLKANKELDETITNKIISEISNLRAQIDKYYTVNPDVQQLAEATVAKYEKEAWVKPLLEGKNKISNIVLDEAVLSGRLSQRDANKIRAAHPNYTPHYKIIEVEGVDSLDIDVQSARAGVLKYRSSNDKLKNLNALDAHVISISKTLQATEMQRRKKGIFDYLIQLDDEAWSVLFREPKEDVLIALEKIKQGGVRKITNEEVTSLNKVPVKEPSVFGLDLTGSKAEKAKRLAATPESFYIDGVELQLTPNNLTFRNILDYKPKDSGYIYKVLHNMAALKRNAITVYNPFFQIRSFLRETEGTMVFGSATPLKDYIPYKTNLENVFSKEIDPKLDEFFKLNYGLGRTYGSDLSGLPLEEQVKRIKADIKDRGLFSSQSLKRIHNTFEGVAEKVELAPRIMEYKIAKSKGKTDAEALALAKELSINFSQKGYSTRWDNFLRTAPFLGAHIKGLDRLVRLGRYEPGQAFSRMALGVYPKYLAIKQWNSLFGDDYLEELYGDERPLSKKLTDDEIILGIPPKLKERLQILLGEDPDNWKKFAQDVRENGGVYNTLRIPRAHAVGILGSIGMDSTVDFIGSSIDLIYDKVIEDKYTNTTIGQELSEQGYSLEQFTRATKDILAGATMPGSVLSPVVSIPMDLNNNKDYFNQPIVPRSIKQHKGRRWTEDKPGTLDSFKAMAKQLARPDRNGEATGIDVSPIQLQYLFQSTLADASLGVIQFGERFFSKVANDGAEDPKLANNKIFGFRQVFGSVGNRRNLPLIDKFYTADVYLGDKKQVYNSLETKAAQSNATPQDVATLQNFYNEYRDELEMYDLFKQAKEDINTIRLDIDEVRNSETIGTEERELFGDPVKADIIRGLEEEMLNIYSSALATSRFWDDEYRSVLARKPLLDNKLLEFADPFEMYKGFKLRQRAEYLEKLEEEEVKKQLDAILRDR